MISVNYHQDIGRLLLVIKMHNATKILQLIGKTICPTHARTHAHTRTIILNTHTYTSKHTTKIHTDTYTHYTNTDAHTYRHIVLMFLTSTGVLATDEMELCREGVNDGAAGVPSISCFTSRFPIMEEALIGAC